MSVFCRPIDIEPAVALFCFLCCRFTQITLATMVRNYVRKTSRSSYSSGTLASVMDKIASGELSKRQAFIQYGIPRSTLAKRMKAPHYSPSSLGRFRKVFSDTHYPGRRNLSPCC